jgi:hypothetical protein
MKPLGLRDDLALEVDAMETLIGIVVANKSLRGRLPGV